MPLTPPSITKSVCSRSFRSSMRSSASMGVKIGTTTPLMKSVFILRSYLTRHGRLLSYFQPGIKYCMPTASSRAPSPFST